MELFKLVDGAQTINSLHFESDRTQSHNGKKGILGSPVDVPKHPDAADHSLACLRCSSNSSRKVFNNLSDSPKFENLSPFAQQCRHHTNYMQKQHHLLTALLRTLYYVVTTTRYLCLANTKEQHCFKEAPRYTPLSHLFTCTSSPCNDLSFPLPCTCNSQSRIHKNDLHGHLNAHLSITTSYACWGNRPLCAQTAGTRSIVFHWSHSFFETTHHYTTSCWLTAPSPRSIPFSYWMAASNCPPAFTLTCHRRCDPTNFWQRAI